VAKDIDKGSVNLHYIRAAIQARTGIRLSLKDVRRYLVEEKLLTPAQARKYAKIFTGYHDFYEDCTTGSVPPKDDPQELTGVLAS
jgi:hypothetical protein